MKSKWIIVLLLGIVLTGCGISGSNKVPPENSQMAALLHDLHRRPVSEVIDKLGPPAEKIYATRSPVLMLLYNPSDGWQCSCWFYQGRLEEFIIVLGKGITVPSMLKAIGNRKPIYTPETVQIIWDKVQVHPRGRMP